jgi:hypothetical protein
MFWNNLEKAYVNSGNYLELIGKAEIETSSLVLKTTIVTTNVIKKLTANNSNSTVENIVESA